MQRVEGFVRAPSALEGRADWRSTVIEGLTRVVEALFLLILVVLPLDAYLVLPSGRTLGFLSQALTMELCAVFGLTLGLGALLRSPAPLRVRLRELAPLGLVLLAALASVAQATSHSVALKDSLKALVYLGIFTVARALLLRPRMRYRALLALLAGATLVVVIGLFNAVPGTPDIAGALLNIQRTAANLPQSVIARESATFRYPNEFASYLILIIPILTACAVTIRDLTERVGFLLLAFAGATLLLLTYTRGALLGVTVALIVLLWLLGGYRMGLGALAALIFGALALVFIPGPMSARLVTVVTNSDSWQVLRFAAWNWALSIFLHHPIFGVGIGNISLQPGAPLVSASQGLREMDAENLLLNVLAEMGVFGALAVLTALAAGLRLTYSGFRAADTWIDRGWNAGALAAIVAVLVFGLTDPVLVSGQVTGLLCAIVGLAGVGVRTVTDESSKYFAVVAQPAAVQTARPQVSQGVARIVFLLNTTSAGGAEVHAINLAGELRRGGTETLIVIPPRSRVEPLLQVRGLPYRVERIGLNAGRWKGFLGTLALADPLGRQQCANVVGALAAQRSSIFVCPFPREQLLVTQMKRRLGLQGVVWVAPGPLHYLPHILILQPMLRRLSRQADLVVAVSETLAEQLVGAGYATDRLEMIPNAVAPVEVVPWGQRPRATIGFVGRLTASKGVAHLIAAMPEVLAQRPDAHLLIAGSGPEEARLRSQVAWLDLSDSVTFLGQINDTRAFYQRLTMLVHPTVEHEGLPTVILEAHNAALPVVASAVDGVTELVEDGETGLLVWPGEAPSLVHAILTVLDDPALARRLAINGWRQTRTYYTLDRAATRFAEATEAIAQGTDVSLRWQSESGKTHIIQRSRFLRDTGILLVGKLLTALATALWAVLAARSLAPASYGDLMLVAGIIDIAAVITDAGLTAAATQALTTASASRAQQFMGTVVWLKIALGVLAAGVALGATVALPFTPEARDLMLLLAPGLLFISLTSLSLLFRARHEASYTLIAALVGAIAGGYGALSVFLSDESASSFARARLLMLVASGGVTLALVALRYRPRWNFDWQAAKHLLRSSALLGLALALNILYYRIDVPLLALLANSAAVAVYTSAYRVLDVATLLPATAAIAALPLLVSQPTRERLSAFASQYLELALVAALLVSSLLTVTAQPVLATLYSDRYDAAYPTMVALAWVAGMTLITNVFSPLAVALEQRRLLLYASGVALAANVALNVVLVPILGSLGAALATLATEVVVTAPLAWVGARTIRLRLHVRPLAAALGATVASLLSQWLLGALLGQGWLMAVLAILIWLAVFAALAPTWVMDMALALRLATSTAPQRARGSGVRPTPPDAEASLAREQAALASEERRP